PREPDDHHPRAEEREQEEVAEIAALSVEVARAEPRDEAQEGRRERAERERERVHGQPEREAPMREVEPVAEHDLDAGSTRAHEEDGRRRARRGRREEHAPGEPREHTPRRPTREETNEPEQDDQEERREDR